MRTQDRGRTQSGQRFLSFKCWVRCLGYVFVGSVGSIFFLNLFLIIICFLAVSKSWQKQILLVFVGFSWKSLNPRAPQAAEILFFLVNMRGQTSDSLLLVGFMKSPIIKTTLCRTNMHTYLYIQINIYIYLYVYTKFYVTTEMTPNFYSYTSSILVRHFDFPSKKQAPSEAFGELQVMIVRFCLKLVEMFAMATWMNNKTSSTWT